MLHYLHLPRDLLLPNVFLACLAQQVFSPGYLSNYERESYIPVCQLSSGPPGPVLTNELSSKYILLN